MAIKMYYFGIGRGKQLIKIGPYIFMNDKGEFLDEYDFHYVDDPEINLDDYFKEKTYAGGSIVGIIKSEKKWHDFEKVADLLAPQIVERNLSIFFIDEMKSVLFKINRYFNTFEEFKESTLKVIRKFSFFNEKEFEKQFKLLGTKDEDIHNYDDFECPGVAFGEVKVSFKIPGECAFLSIHSPSYEQLKQDSMKKFKDTRNIKKPTGDR